MLTTIPERSLNLNQYGGACRCLLRLREDEGYAGISDRQFIREHVGPHPEWNERPGAADARALLELARQLGVADEFELSRDYLHVLDEHHAGSRVLVCTERPPQVSTSELPYDRYVTVIEQMDEASFTLWCPYRSGHSDVLPAAPVVWWDRWRCVAILLRKSVALAHRSV
ncbi:MAG TPA: hypothetical protein VNR00_12030 [Opitutus sp.]|nr:hypothetical protein [Opitutus sp.]